MKHAEGVSGAHISLGHNEPGGEHAFIVPDAHLLFSGEFQRSGRDLIISDNSQRVVVRDYFQNKHTPQLVSADGAQLDSKVVEVLTGYVEVAQAGGLSAGKVVGHVVKMTGSASVVRNGVTAVLNVGDAVYQNDVVQTGSSSTLGLVLDDGTAFNLSASARLMLNELNYDAGSTSNSSLITLVQGAASFVAGQVAKTGDMKIATPSAVLGIRGTVVQLDVSSTDGKVEVSVINQNDGLVHTVEVRDNLGTLIATVSSNGPALTLTATPTFQLIAQETAKAPAQVAAEAQQLVGVLQTYDAGKQMNPNLPQHTQNDKGGDDKSGNGGDKATNKADATDKGGDNNNATTKATTATSSASATSAGTEFKAPGGTSVLNVDSSTTPITVVINVPVTGGGNAAGAPTTPAAVTADSTPSVVAKQPATAPVIATVTGGSSSRVADSGFTKSTTLTVSGTADAGNTVNIFDTDGVTVVGSGVATGGNYLITTSALSEGSHTLTAKATDATGNDAVSKAFNVTIDTTAPPAPAIGAVAHGASPGTVADNGVTNETTLTITGTAEAGSSVTVYDTDGTTVLGTGVATASGYSITTSALNEGSHTLTIKATDVAGNEGAASTAFHVTIDTSAPSAPVIASVIDDAAPLTGPLISGGSTDDTDLTVTVALSGTGAVVGDTIQLYDGTGTTSQLATYTLTVTDIANGFADVQTGALSNANFTLTARITDAAGNQSGPSGSFIVTETGAAPNAPSISSLTDDASPVTGTVADNGFSNDTTLTVTGTAEVGSTVTLYDTDGTTVVGSGVATGGTYTITTSALGEGSHTLTATATSPTGSEGAASTAFHVTIDTSAPGAPAIGTVTDNVSPITGTVADNGFSNDTTLTVTGTAEAGSTVTLYDTDGTTVLGSAIAIGGAYTITTSVLSQGVHTLTAKATDAAGNQGAASTAFHVTVDTSAPAAPVIGTVIDDVSPATGTVADNGFSNDTTLTLTGTAEAGSTVTIYDTDGTTVLGTGVATGGTYTITTSGLGTGSHTLTAKATDAAGNQGAASAAFHVTIDASAPVAPVIGTVTDNVSPITGTVADNGTSNDTTLTITGTAEAGSTVTVYDTDGTTVLGTGVATGGTYTITTSALGSGSHTLTAKATDAAGNQGTASTAFHVTIDASAPAAPSITSVTDDVSPVTGTVADNGATNDTTLTLTGTAEAGSTVTIYDTDGTTALGSGVATGGTYTITTSALGSGSHTLTAKATDAAGNQGTASTAFHVTIDASAPAAPSVTSVTDDVSPVTGTVTDNGFSNDATLTVTGTAEAGSTVTIYDTDGTTVLGTGVATGGTYTITTSALGTGSHTLTAKATDATGNQGAASSAFHVNIDTSAPTAPAIGTVTDNVSPITGTVADNGTSNDTTLTVTGTAEAGSTVTVYDTDGTTVVGSGVAAGGAYTITTTALGSGSHTLTAKATDAAGNQGAASTAFHVTIDTTPPNAPSIASVTDDIAPVTGPLTSGGSTNDTDLTVRVGLGGTLAVAGDTVQLYNGTSTGSQLGTSYTLTAADIVNGFADVQTGVLGNGTTYTITARVSDAGGNQSAASGSFVVTETGTAPNAPSITSVTDDIAPVTGPVSNGGSTNDTDLAVRVGLGGTNAVAGNTVQLYNGTGTGSQLGTSYTLTAGDIANGFADVQTGALSNGTTYALTARITDGAGNQSNASSSFVVTEDTSAPTAPAIGTVTDNVSPITGTVADNGFSNDTTLTVTGTAEAGSTVTIYDTDGTTVLGTGVATGGTYTITTSVLSQGSHTLTAKAADAAGNQGTASTAFHVTIDASAPAAPSITSVTDDVSPVTGTVADNGATNDTTLTLTGTAEAGSTVTIYDTDGTTVLGTGVATGGTYTITTLALGSGSHTLTAKATDGAGNQGTASTAFHVTIDTSAPAAPVIGGVTDDVSPITGTVADNGFSNDTTLTVTGTAETGSTVTLYDTDGTTVLGTGVATGGTYTITTSALGTGSHTLTAKATDTAGNQGAASTAFHVTVDASAPVAPVIGTVTDNLSPITGTVADNGTSNDATLTISGTAEVGSTVTLYDTDGTTVLGTGVATGGIYTITTSALGSGSHTLTAKATDAAGNQGTASTAFHVTIDASAPAAPSITSVTDDVSPVTGTVADNGATNDTTLTITGTAEAGSTVTIYDTDGTTVLGSVVAAGGTYTITTSVLSQGVHTLTAKATDTAGNQGAASTAFHVTVDSSAPTDITLSNASVAENSAAGTLVGSLADVDPGAAGTASFTLLDDAGGRFAISGGNLVVAGSFDYETAHSHQVTVRVTDSAGNIFDKALTIAVTDVAGITLNGDAGANVLVGTVEADTLNGLDGNDRLQGLGGNDQLDGGLGSDRAVYTDATGGVTINLAAGTASGAGVGSDTLIGIEGAVGSDFADTFNATGFTGSTGQPGVAIGQNSFEGRSGNDIITGQLNPLGQAVTRAEYLSATGPVTVDLAARTADGDVSVGHDTLTNVSTVWGSAFNDTFFGSNNAAFTYETYEGRGGDDFIDGRGGYDQVTYNNDTTTTSGITVDLAAGTVTGDATVGTDTIRDVEAVRGTNFNDVFDASGYGLAGALNVSSALGNFNEFGGMGGNDTIIGNGNTRLNFAVTAASVSVDLETSPIGTTTAVTVAGMSTGATEGTDTFTGVNAVQGSVFGDTVLGSSFSNTFTGLAGDDYLDGRGGFDTASYNSLNSVTGGVTVNMAAGSATGDASIGSDTLRNIEGIQGTAYADTYNATGYGQAGALNVSTSNGNFNQFEGLGGNDSITGNGNTRVLYSNATGGVTITIGAGGSGSATGDSSTGTDTFTGGVNSAIGSNSADTYTASAFNNGFNSFQGNSGNDTITGNGATQAQYGSATSGVTITINAGGAGSATGDGSVGTDTFVSGVNSALGGNLADTYNASSFVGFNSFQGQGGNDTITGNGSTQIQYGAATGGVTITIGAGGTGSAIGDGSVGTDTFTGGVNGATGSNFSDSYNASAFNSGVFNSFQGNAGNDNITGNGSTQIQYNNATAAVTVNLTSGTATGDSSVGFDTITGGVNSVLGSNFNDTLSGSSGSDFLSGNGGNDTINGLAGNDNLSGGLGADTFIYANGGGADFIGDFNHSEDDRIDLTAVSGIISFADVQSRASQQGSNTLIDFGGGNTITLANVIVGNLVAGDFILGNSVTGTSGNDVLVGTGQVDNIFALEGNDRLQGLDGNDTLDGGFGFDRAVYLDATGGVTINLAAGTASGAGVGGDTLIGIEGAVGSDFADTFDATGFTGDSGTPGTQAGFNEFEGRAGNDTITGATNSQGAMLTRLSYANATAGATVDLVAHTATGNSSVGSDTLVGSGFAGVVGSGFVDQLLGSDNMSGTVEVFEGRAGNDTINGRGGFDRADYALDTAAVGGISVNLAAGIVTGDATTVGTDTLLSVESVRGSNSADTFDATGFGSGSTNAGSNGTFNEFNGMGGNDTIIGNGNTRLAFVNATGAVFVDLQTGATPGTGIATGDSSTGTDGFSGVNAVMATMFDDTVFGSDNTTTETFTGLAGNDHIDGRGGFDIASYNNIYFSTGPVTVNMAAGTATGDASIGTDTLRNIEGIQGTNFNDVYSAIGYGSAGAFNVGSNGNFNQFEGLGGNDTITGNGNTRVLYGSATGSVTITIGASGAGSAIGDSSTGTDTFTGGVNTAIGSNSADTYNASAFNNGFNSFQGNSGNDTITGNGSTQVQYGNATGGVTITIGTGGAGSAAGDGSVGTDTFVSGVNSALGGNLADTYNAGSLVGFNSFQGQGGNDTITGNGSTQIQYGAATGGVMITIGAGGTGSVIGDGSVGTDTITGGVNSATGSNFADSYDASAFNSGVFNSFQGNAGNDNITGNGSTQIQYNNATAAVTVNLTSGTATGDSSVGFDTITGGVNSVIGSNFNDTLSGSSGSDFLSGNGGNDTINGLAGNDNLSGGLGADTFIYANGGGADFIGDFNHSEDDRIDLTAVSGIISFADVQSRASQQGSNTLIDFGGGNTITLANVIVGNLVAGDFILGNSVTGTSGNDVLVGTGQVDNIFALDGNDRLQGLGGNDQLDGGLGSDRAVYTDATGGVTINLAAGTASGAGVGSDTLIGIEGAVGSDFADTFNATGFTGSTGQPGVAIGQNSFEGRSGNDIITGQLNPLGQAVTRAEYLSATGPVTVDLAARTADGDVSVGHDTLTNVSTVWGSAFNDTFFGSNNAAFTYETYEGRGGDDFIDGRGGYDQVTYNNDTTTTSGITVDLAAGTVTGDATVGTDTIRDVEAVRGTNFNDVFDASGYGLAGALNVSSALGNFNEFGGMGGNDTIIGNGNTRLNFAVTAASVSVDLETSPIGTTTAVTVAGMSTGATEGTDTFTGVNAVQGSVFGDTVLGSSFSNTFTGLAGDDYLDGRGGFDTASYNSLNSVTGGVTVNMAAGSATGDASIGSDTLRNIEGIQGTAYADTYNATGYGQAGALNVSTSNGNFNQFEGLGGNDSITGNGNTRVLYSNATGGVTITIGAGGSGSATGDSSTGTDTFTGGVNSAIGSNSADTYTASAFNNGFNSFQGNSGNDTITGNGATQAQYGSATSGVTITINAGGAGSATGDGSVGTDTFVSGVNSALGGNLADTYNASSFVGFNSFQGQGGNDTITGNGSTQIQYGNATAGVTVNLVTGTATGDSSVGTDTITGGVNSVVGSNFTDTLSGGSSNDFLSGNGGNDRLQGFGGNDQLDGGLGFDRAVYLDATGGVTINLAAGTASGAGVGGDTLIGIEGAVGSDFADTFDATGFTGDSGTPGTQAGFNEFEGRAGNDTITGATNSQGAMLTRLSYANATAGATVDLVAHTATGNSSVGSDTLVGSGFAGVVGSGFVDQLLGSDNMSGTVEVFEGRAGNDTINGRGGFDRADYALDTAAVGGISVNLAAGIVTGDATTVGTDTLLSVESVRGSNSADTFDATGFGSGSTNAGSNGTFNEFNGMGGNDTIIGNGNTRLAFVNATGAVFVDLQTGATPGTGIATGDSSTGTDGFSGVNAVMATMFDDTVFGSDNTTTETFTGLAGNDHIDGRGGFDIASYNNIYFSTGPVTINTAAGIATGDTSIGTDTLRDIEGIQGTNFNDTYDATGYGQAGALNVSTTHGDFNQFEGLGGNDTITGNADTRVSYNSATGSVTITMGAGGAGSATGDSSVGTDTFTGGVSSAVGSNSADTYNASAFNNGSNAFQGQGGDDTITGNGSTQIQYSNATAGVTVDLAAGNATGDSSVGTDTITGGVNSVLGSNFNDVLRGTAGADVLNGSGGDDTIIGRGGADILTGGAGNDNFVFTSGATAGATITDFTGNGASTGDTLEFHGFGLASEGANLTQLSANQWQVHSGLNGHNEIITINGNVHPSDYQFLV